MSLIAIYLIIQSLTLQQSQETAFEDHTVKDTSNEETNYEKTSQRIQNLGEKLTRKTYKNFSFSQDDNSEVLKKKFEALFF